MKQNVFLLCLVLLSALGAVSCTLKPQPPLTDTLENQGVNYEPMEVSPTTQPTSTNAPESFNNGECHSTTKRIELNTSLPEGVGPSYSFPDVCSVYCLWVPDGAQLKIGISDLHSNVNMLVAQDLFTRWDSGSGTEDRSVTISNPSGLYYIWVCPEDSSLSFTKSGSSLIESSDVHFTLFNEFTP